MTRISGGENGKGRKEGSSILRNNLSGFAGIQRKNIILFRKEAIRSSTHFKWFFLTLYCFL
jgi:hypothetical protein